MSLGSLIDGAPAPEAADVAARAEGALLGLAVGNMLGVPVEFETKADLAARYPDGLREIDPRLADEEWDDDLAQAIVIAEALAERGSIDVHDLAARLLVWRDENGSGIGALTADVLEELEAGTPVTDAARIAWERSDGTSAGNGAVMRCAPVAIRWHRDGQHLVADALASAAVTHHDPRCTWSTAVTVAAIALLLRGEQVDLGALASAVREEDAPPEVADAIDAIAGQDIDALALDGWDQGYTLKAMQVGLWCAVAPLAFEDTLVRVVMQGGDADTNGAVAGAVAGARHGIGGVPERWLDLVPSSERLHQLVGDLLHCLDRLARGITDPGGANGGVLR